VSDILEEPQDLDLESTASGSSFLPQVDLPEDILPVIGSWLQEQLFEANASMSEYIDNLEKWTKQYEGIPSSITKDFPWENSSNLEVPISAIHVDTVFSRMMNSIFGAKDLIVGRARAKKWVELVPKIERWLNWVTEEVMDFYRFSQDWFLSTIKFGTGIAELPWVNRVRRTKMRDETGAIREQEEILHDGPLPRMIPLKDFRASSDSFYRRNLQDCEWVAIRGYYTAKQIEEKIVSQEWLSEARNLIEMQNQRTSADKVEAVTEGQQGVSPVTRNDFEVWRFYASYDVDGDGRPEEIIVDFHDETKTIVRAVYNFYFHQERPLHMITFMPREGSLFGIGVCQMLEHIQAEITTIHNQRIDNGTIANTKMFLKRATAKVTGKVFPGAFISINTSLDDIREVRLGDPLPSQLREEMHTNAYAERRTGVSDYSVGRESSAIGSRATATSTMALIGEANKRFLMTIRDARNSITDMAHQVIMLYQQFATDRTVMYELFDEKEQQMVQEFIELPQETTRARVILDVPVADDKQNKDIQKQTLLALMGVLQNYFMGVFQALSVGMSPEAPEPMKQLAMKGAEAATKLMERILDAFEVTDTENFLPDMQDLFGLRDALANQLLALGGPNAQPFLGTGDDRGSGAPRGEPPMDNIEAGGREQDTGNISPTAIGAA
jgi:hypothetical protein